MMDEAIACHGAKTQRISEIDGYKLPAASSGSMAHPAAGHPLRFAVATRASGWTKTQFRCYIKPGCVNGGRSWSALSMATRKLAHFRIWHDPAIDYAELQFRSAG